MVRRVAGLGLDPAVDDVESPAQDVVDRVRPRRPSARIARQDPDDLEGVVERAGQADELGQIDRGVEVAGHDDRVGSRHRQRGQGVGLALTLGGACVAEVRVQDPHPLVADRHVGADDAAGLAAPVRRVGEGDPRERPAAVGRFDVVVVRPGRQALGERLDERAPAEQGVAPLGRADRPAGLGLDQRERVDRRVADVGAREPGDLGRLVEERAVDGQHGHLLEGDDVRIERADDPGDPFEPLAIDVAPPGRRERLARPDRRPDVPGCDANPGPALIEPRLLDRARQQSLDEEALQAEEDEERDDHQQERAGGQQMPFRAVLREQVLDRPGHRVLRGVLDEHEGHQQVVPDPQELEDPVRGDGRHREGHDDRPEDPDLPGTVDAGRLDEVTRQRDEEVAQQEDPERQRERGMDQPDRAEAGGQAERPEQGQERDERDLDRHEQQRDHEQEQRVAEREAQPRERVGGHRRQRERQERRRDGDDHVVDERLDHALRVEDLLVVLGREPERQDGLPPAGRLDVGPRSERRDEEADGRGQPDQRDETQGDVDRGPAQAVDDASTEGRGLRLDGRAGEGVVFGCHTTDAARKRRTLKIMIGIRISIITTATAAALPKSPAWNPST